MPKISKDTQLPLYINGTNVKQTQRRMHQLRTILGYWPKVEAKGTFEDIDGKKLVMPDYFLFSGSEDLGIVTIPLGDGKVLTARPIGGIDVRFLPEPYPRR